MWDATNIGFDLACPAWCRSLLALACQHQETEISGAGSPGCPLKRLIQITQSIQGERRAQRDVKDFFFAAKVSGPSRIVEFNLQASMRPFDGPAQAPGLG